MEISRITDISNRRWRSELALMSDRELQNIYHWIDGEILARAHDAAKKKSSSKKNGN